MSAASRTRPWIALPLRSDDYIVSLIEHESGPLDGELVATTKQGRTFAIRRVARYKRAFKVREIHGQVTDSSYPAEK